MIYTYREYRVCTVYRTAFIDVDFITRTVALTLTHTLPPTAVLPCTAGSVPELRSNSSDLIETKVVRCGKMNETVEFEKKHGSKMMISVWIIYIYTKKKFVINSTIL